MCSLVYRLSFLGLIYLTRVEPLRGREAADKSLVNQVVLYDDNEGRLSGLKKKEKDSSSTFFVRQIGVLFLPPPKKD